MKFEKITLDEAIAQTKPIRKVYAFATKKRLDNLALPTRSTSRSAGYDFHTPFSIRAKKGDTVAIPLFIKVIDMPSDVVLFIFNRSGLSLKKGLRLDNSVGVIDADYKQGIIFQATANKDIEIKEGDRICQGIFVHYLTVDDDEAEGERTGGFGSTGR